MPTILRIDGLRVVVYPNDHRQAHVHVMSAGAEAVFILHCPDGPTELREAYGMSLAAVRDVADTLNTKLSVLCERWRNIHGDY